ncbi:AAA family ATPase [Corynebacterium auriscanis]|uniref:AAA family ATPase n=1 Tax=Corynebacterium auriscanis TaxID=99807 RepID=UPI003CFB2B1A
MSTQGFWIRRISFSGDLVGTSTVEFKPGFNIVHGPSDTGKTYLAKSIKYMLAGGTAPFSKSIGYDQITMVLETGEGTVHLTRDIDSSQMTVSAPSFGVLTGTYPVIPTERDPKAYTVSDLLLAILGVKERRTVITNKYGTHQILTWRNFADVLHRSESRITSEESIFSTDKCSTLSAFLTLFFDRDLSLVTEHPDPAVVKTKAGILRPHINRMIDDVLAEIQKLHELAPTDVDKLEAQLEELLNRFNELSEENNHYRQQLKDNAHELSEATKARTQKEFELQQYEELATIYLGNIERLNAIADAENKLSKLDQPETCPYCNAPMSSHHSVDYSTAAHNEAVTTAHNLHDLAEVRRNASDEIAALAEVIAHLEDEQRSIEARLSGILLPELSKIRQAIDTLEDQRDVVRRIQFLEDRHTILTKALSDVPDPQEPPHPFEPAKEFPKQFYDAMTRNLQTILGELHFEDAELARFNEKDFDVRIRGKRKRSHGKGMRAFLNTVVLLALHKYIAENAIHQPSLIVLDTPTLGLEHQGKGDQLITSRDESTGRPRTGLLRNLFDYMRDAGQYGQIIVLNNTDVTPTTNFDYDDSTELIFGDGPEAHRPGLLRDLREENADELDSQSEGQGVLFE